MADAGIALPAAGRGRRLAPILSGLVFIAIVVGLWKLVVTVFAIPAFMMPPPEAALAALRDNAATIGQAVFFTLRNAAAGLAVAFIIAMLLAAIFVSSRFTTRAVLPIVIGLRTAPVLAIAPILIMVFGRGIGTAIVVVVIVSFFPIMVNAMRGFTATPRSAMELMHVLGAGWFATFAKVRLPFSVPFIFTGLRSAATSAMLSAMLAEWLSGAPGLGTLILDASSYRKTGLLWAGVVVSMVVAFAIFTLTTAARTAADRMADDVSAGRAALRPRRHRHRPGQGHGAGDRPRHRRGGRRSRAPRSRHRGDRGRRRRSARPRPAGRRRVRPT